jgi:hypothetical protein
MRRAPENVIDLGCIAVAHGGDDVVGRLRPHHGRAGLCCLHWIDHGGQYFVFDSNCFGRALRQRARTRNNGCDRFAGETHKLVRQEPAWRHRHRRTVRPLEDRERRDRTDLILDKVGAGIDGRDALHCAGGLGVDRFDRRMRMRRAQHIEPQRAVFRLVVDEMSLPGEQPLIFQTLDRLSRAKTQIAGKNIHQFGPSSFFELDGVLASLRRDTTTAVVPGWSEGPDPE